jgi:hypothetical protein
VSPVDIIGLVGVGLIILAYILLQAERVKHSSLLYLGANGLGAGLVLFTLYFDFNLASAVVEGFWVAVSVYGVWRSRRTKPEASG